MSNRHFETYHHDETCSLCARYVPDNHTRVTAFIGGSKHIFCNENHHDTFRALAIGCGGGGLKLKDEERDFLRKFGGDA